MDFRSRNYWWLWLPVLGLSACTGTPPSEPPAAPAAVSVLAIQPQDITLQDTLPGRVVAVRSAEIRPQVGGIVVRRLFEQGSEVRAGQPLYQLNPAPLKAELAAAQAALAHAEVTYARSQRQAERLRPLLDADGVSQQAYDDAVSERDMAQANLAQARANLQRRRLDLEYATVQAPISGRIGAELVSEGTLVAPTDSAPMARVQQIDQVYVDVLRPASTLLARQPDHKTAPPVTILGADGRPYVGTARVLLQEQQVDPATGDSNVRILVNNPDHVLLPGMFVRASMARASAAPQLLVPQQAVQRSADGQAYVWVIDKTQRAMQRQVNVGEVIAHQYLIHTGLQAGELLVVEGQEHLHAGSVTKPRLWRSATAAAGSSGNTRQ